MQPIKQILIEKSGWIYFLLAGFLLLLHLPILADIFSRWISEGINGPYAHGPVLVLICLYLVYKTIKRNRSKLVLSLSPVGILLLVGCQLLLFVSLLADIDLFQHLLLALTLMLLVWSLFTFQVMLKFTYPFLVLLLTLPLWGVLLPVLQTISLKLTSFLMSTTTIPFYREDFSLHLPNGIFEVAPGCAGLQQFLVALILAVLYAYMRVFSFRSLLKLVIIISLLAVSLNAIRIFIIVLIGYNTEMRSSIVEEHVTLGWIVFAIGMYAFMFVYERYVQVRPAKTDEENTLNNVQVPSDRTAWLSLSGIVVALLAPGLLSQVIFARVNSQAVTPISVQVPGWETVGTQSTNDFTWVPKVKEADDYLQQSYASGDRRVYLHVNQFNRLKDEYEPINITTVWFDNKYWNRAGNSALQVKLSNEKTEELGLLTLHSPNRQVLLLLHGYVVNGHVTGSLLDAKLQMLFGLLQFRYNIKTISLAVYVDQDDESARQTLKQFFSATSW